MVLKVFLYALLLTHCALAYSVVQSEDSVPAEIPSPVAEEHIEDSHGNKYYDAPFQPPVDVEDSQAHEDEKTPGRWNEMIDIFHNGGWSMLKTRVSEMMSLLDRDGDSILPVDAINKFLGLGDALYFVQTLQKRLDPKLATFLSEQLSPVLKDFNSVTSLADGDDSPDSWSGFLKKMSYKGMDLLASKTRNLVKSHISEKDLADYANLIHAANPAAAEGMAILLDLSSEQSETGRQFYPRSPQYYDDGTPNQHVERSGGYGGHGGGFHGGGGYGGVGGGGGFGLGIGQAYGQFHLPLLFGLAVGAFLGYLFYAITTTTVEGRSLDGGRFKRDALLGGVEMGDFNSILPPVEEIAQRIGIDPSANEIEGDDLISNINALWSEYEAEKGCVRCVLFKRMKNRLSFGNKYLEDVLTAGMAHLLGSEGSGQLLDEATQ